MAGLIRTVECVPEVEVGVVSRGDQRDVPIAALLSRTVSGELRCTTQQLLDRLDAKGVTARPSCRHRFASCGFPCRRWAKATLCVVAPCILTLLPAKKCPAQGGAFTWAVRRGAPSLERQPVGDLLPSSRRGRHLRRTTSHRRGRRQRRRRRPCRHRHRCRRWCRCRRLLPRPQSLSTRREREDSDRRRYLL